MESHSQSVGERLQVAVVALIADVAHAYVHAFYAEAWLVYAASLGEHLQKKQRVLAARQPDEYLVAVGYQLIVGDGLVEPSLQTGCHRLEVSCHDSVF